jgi:hypothetical protein
MPLQAPFERLHNPTLMPQLLRQFSIVVPAVRHQTSPEHWKPSHWAVLEGTTDATVLVLLCEHCGHPCAFVLDLAEHNIYQVKMKAPKSFFIGTVFMAEISLTTPTTLFVIAFLYAQGSVLHVSNVRNVDITKTMTQHLWIDHCAIQPLPLCTDGEDVSALREAARNDVHATTLLEVHVFPWYRCLCVQKSTKDCHRAYVVLNGGCRYISQAARCNRVNTTRP